MLWFGGSGGVTRYDPSVARTGGKAFTVVVGSGTWGQTFRAIHRDADGFLWFGSDQAVLRYDGKSFLFFDKADGLPCEWVSSIQSSPDREVWFAGDGGIARHDART